MDDFGLNYNSRSPKMNDNCKDSLLIKALKKEPIERTPVWIMRQAGRYLPEYRQTRAKAGSFMNLCQNPELACEVTLQPLKRYALDAAITFSDILTIPDAMGLGLSFIEGEGPVFQHPIDSKGAIEALKIPNIQSELSYVYAATALIRKEMPSHLPLIGFSGSPWTLACYMVQGRSVPGFPKLLELSAASPTLIQELLEKLALTVSDYLISQADAGANILMIFDTWGGLLNDHTFKTFSLNYLTFIVNRLQRLRPEIPVILFTKGGDRWLESLAETGAAGLGLDWNSDLTMARIRVGNKVALQGNLNPSVLLESPDLIREKVKKVLEAYGQGSGHIFNLGHGITPDVPPDHLKVLIEAVHEYSPFYHQ